MSLHPRVFVSLLAVAACAPSAPTWHQDLKPIVDAPCVSCHQEGAIAPFPLTSYDQAKPIAGALASAVSSKTMPPWSAGPADVHYRATRRSPRTRSPSEFTIRWDAEEDGQEAW